MERSGRWEITIDAENFVSKGLQLQGIAISRKFPGGGGISYFLLKIFFFLFLVG
jgi:hypothetical protein